MASIQRDNVATLLKDESFIQDLGKALVEDVEALEREL